MRVSDALHTDTERTHTALLRKWLYSPTDPSDSPTDSADSTDSTDSDLSPAREAAQDGRAPIKACSIMCGAVLHPQVMRGRTLPWYAVRPRTGSSA